MKRRRHDNTLTKYVIFSIFILIAYTVTELIITTNTGTEHSTLTTCLFATFGGEILTCALIKIFKLKKEGENNGQF